MATKKQAKATKQATAKSAAQPSKATQPNSAGEASKGKSKTKPLIAKSKPTPLAGKSKPAPPAGKSKPAPPAGKSKTKAAHAAAAKPEAPQPKTAKPGKAPAKPRKPALASASAANGAAFKKVAFTLFNVKDPQRARDFYENTLGLTRGLSAGNGQWTEYDLPGGGCLALFYHPQFGKEPGGASIAFEVSDLDALNQRLQAAGVTYQGDLVHGPNCRMSNILDSEGNGIILHQLNHA